MEMHEVPQSLSWNRVIRAGDKQKCLSPKNHRHAGKEKFLMNLAKQKTRDDPHPIASVRQALRNQGNGQTIGELRNQVGLTWRVKSAGCGEGSRLGTRPLQPLPGWVIFQGTG